MARRCAPYALCEHGPRHVGQPAGPCGFGHRLKDLDLPWYRYDRGQWVDEDDTRVSRGRAGIDTFLGQRLSSRQLQRVGWYLAYEPTRDWPRWARCLAWFTHMLPVEFFCEDGDFGFCELVEKVCPLWGGNVPSEAVYNYKDWPFRQMRDGHGRTLVERLVARKKTLQKLEVHVCDIEWEYVVHENALCQYAAEARGRHLSVRTGRSYLKLAVSENFWLVAPLEEITRIARVAGWAPASSFPTSSVSTLPLYELPRLQTTLSSCHDGVAFGAGLAPLHASLDSGRYLALVTHGCQDGGLGLAAAWFVGGDCCHCGRASMKVALYGQGAAELFGILGGLLRVWRLLSSGTNSMRRVVCMSDCRAVVGSCFHGLALADDDWHLYPGILAVRLVLEALRSRSVDVQGRWLEYGGWTLAHEVARLELDKRWWHYWEDSDVFMDIGSFQSVVGQILCFMASVQAGDECGGTLPSRLRDHLRKLLV